MCGTALSERPVEVWERFRLLECPRCALQAWDPPSTGSGEWYDTSGHYATTPFIDWLGWYHSKALDELAQRGVQTLLDIGCGDGRFVYAAARRGIDARGIDHSERLVRTGNARHGGERLSVTSIDELRATGTLLDAVTMFDVVEHVSDPLALLRLAVPMLGPGGTLAVSTPSRLGYPWGTHPLDRPPHHVTRWTPSTLRMALERAGLRDIRIETSPGAVGLRSLLMDRVSFGLVSRALKGSGETGRSAPRDERIRAAVVLKDRSIRLAARALAPLFGGRFAGGSMVAFATR